MAAKRKAPHTPDERAAILAKIGVNGATAVDVAKEAGVSTTTLRNWQQAGKKASGKKARRKKASRRAASNGASSNGHAVPPRAPTIQDAMSDLERAMGTLRHVIKAWRNVFGG